MWSNKNKKNNDDLNCLSLIQLTANESIIDLITEESFANMYFRIKGTSFMRLSTTTGFNNITLFKDAVINGNASITGRLEVALDSGLPTNWINLHTDNSNNNGDVGYSTFLVWGGKNSVWDTRSSTSTNITSDIRLDNTTFMKFFYTNNEIKHYKPLVNNSDDRFKENE